MPAALPSHHNASIALCGSSLRRLLPNFIGVVVPSLDCPWAEAVTGASEGGDNGKTTVPAVQKCRKGCTNFGRGSSG